MRFLKTLTPTFFKPRPKYASQTGGNSGQPMGLLMALTYP